MLSKTFPDRDSADKWVASLSENNQKQIQDIMDSYLRDIMIVDGKRRGGYESISGKLVNLSNFFKCELKKISKDDVMEYMAFRKKKVSNGTIRLEVQLLSRLLRWCMPLGLVEYDITKEVVLPKAGKPRDKIISDLDFSRILSYSSEVMKPIFILGFETAMRRNEILSIKPCMVNAKKRIIHLDESITKNGEARDVPLSKVALALLKELCDGRDGKQKLFTAKPHSVTRAFKRASTKAGIKGVCFHSLRHSCITRYAERDFNTLQLQCISGHKDITSLAGYTHIRAEKIAELMDK